MILDKATELTFLIDHVAYEVTGLKIAYTISPVKSSPEAEAHGVICILHKVVDGKIVEYSHIFSLYDNEANVRFILTKMYKEVVDKFTDIK